MEIAFYVYDINDIGGVESWLYYISLLYGKNHNLTLYYTQGATSQLDRYIKNYMRVIPYKGQKVICDKAIFCYDTGPIANFEANEKIQFIHKIIDKTFIINNKINKYYAVSKAAGDIFTEYTGQKCQVLYNPIYLDKPKKVLRLISPTRISDDKGPIWKMMQKFADKLNSANIPFTWLIFTNNHDQISGLRKGMILVNPELDIENYIADSDYLVQFSLRESSSYTCKQALGLGIPVLVTNFNTVDELGIIDGINGYIFDMNLSNVDVNKIYNKIPKDFKYKMNDSSKEWEELLGKPIKRELQEMVKVRLVYNDTFQDIVDNVIRYPNEEWWMTKERAEGIIKNFTNQKIIDIIK